MDGPLAGVVSRPVGGLVPIPALIPHASPKRASNDSGAGSEFLGAGAEAVVTRRRRCGRDVAAAPRRGSSPEAWLRPTRRGESERGLHDRADIGTFLSMTTPRDPAEPPRPDPSRTDAPPRADPRAEPPRADRGAMAPHGPGGGRRSKRHGQPQQPRDNRGLMAVAVLAGLAVVVAGAALFMTLTRPTPVAEGSCRTVAWDALPPRDSLPDGWTINGSGFYTDGFGASLSGPTPSAAQAGQGGAPAVNLRVSCYGADGHRVIRRSHDSDIAVGGTNVPFADIGDEALATRDSAGTTTSVYMRRGALVASIAAQGVSPDDLEQLASAVDDGMIAAEEKSAGSPGAEPSSTGDEAAVPTDEGFTDEGFTDDGASGSPEPTPTEAHAFVDLEAIFPKTVDGTTMASRSTTGTEALQSDPSSDELIAWLAANGKKPADLEVAELFDPTAVVDLDMTALRVKGIAALTLRQELLKTWLGATASGITTTEKTIGGKSVLVIDYGDQGPPDYVLVRGDSVVILASSDSALAARILTDLK